MTHTQQWWWCLDHQAVEPASGCPNSVRLGPYPTRAEAARAIERAHERTEAWDEKEREWEQGSGGGGAAGGTTRGDGS